MLLFLLISLQAISASIINIRAGTCYSFELDESAYLHANIVPNYGDTYFSIYFSDKQSEHCTDNAFKILNNIVSVTEYVNYNIPVYIAITNENSLQDIQVDVDVDTGKYVLIRRSVLIAILILISTIPCICTIICSAVYNYHKSRTINLYHTQTTHIPLNDIVVSDRL